MCIRDSAIKIESARNWLPQRIGFSPTYRAAAKKQLIQSQSTVGFNAYLREEGSLKSNLFDTGEIYCSALIECNDTRSIRAEFDGVQ